MAIISSPHLPLILGPDHKKLSKRSGDTAVLDYRDKGYLPEAMVNFLALLGWSLDDHTSILGAGELKRHFDLARVVPNPAVFDIERLNHLNGHYIRALDDGRWEATITEWCARQLPESVKRPIDPDIVKSVAPLLKERVSRLDEIAGMVEFLFGYEAPEYELDALTERVGGAAPGAAPPPRPARRGHPPRPLRVGAARGRPKPCAASSG